MLSLRRTRAVASKELRHILRDHRMRPMLLVVPVMQLTILGYAANMDVDHVKLAIVDQDRSPASREITGRLDAGSAFDVLRVGDDERAAERALDEGSAELVLLLPRGLHRGLTRGESVDVPVWVDGTDTNRGMMAQGFVERVLAEVSDDRLPVRPMGPGLPGRPDVRTRILYNPALSSRWFMVPGVVVMVLAVLTSLLSAMAIVKERENGTIEQLTVTPIQPAELIVGKLVPFVGIGLFIAALVTIAARVVFAVPFRGDPLVLLGMCLLFLLSTLGSGLLASTLSQTQQQATLAIFMVLMPSFLLGGVFYPVSNMPDWAQTLAAFTPVRYFIAIVRALFLKGAGPGVLASEAAALGAIGLVVLLVAMLRFRKRST
ncbi:MAG: ABC transporter permease [Alphaproteobacteria bacterium]|nr:ABC transporter permease [Alphaproteobacteria bacterium]